MIAQDNRATETESAHFSVPGWGPPSAPALNAPRALSGRHGPPLRSGKCTSNLPAIMELVSMGYGIFVVFDSHLRHQSEAKPITCYSFGRPPILWRLTKKEAISPFIAGILSK